MQRAVAGAVVALLSCALAGCGLGSVGYDADRRRAERASPSGAPLTPGAPEPGAPQAVVLGPYDEPEDGQPRVTSALARQVVADYDAANNRANDARSDGGISAIEAGAMLEIDLASYASSRALDDVRDFAPGEPFTTADPVFALQPTTTYPARFLVIGTQQTAGAGTDAEATSTIMQFVRESADTTWKLEHVANAATASDLQVDVDANGYVTSTAVSPLDPAAVGPAVVTTLNGSQTGVTFAPDAGPELAVAGYLAARDVGLGLELEPTDGRTVGSWPLRGGGLLVLTSFRSDVSIRPAQGQELQQPATRDIFSALLEPGRYAEVRLRWLGLQAWATAGAAAPLRLVGAYDGELSADGDKTGEVSDSPAVEA